MLTRKVKEYVFSQIATNNEVRDNTARWFNDRNVTEKKFEQKSLDEKFDALNKRLDSAVLVLSQQQQFIQLLLLHTGAELKHVAEHWDIVPNAASAATTKKR